MIFFVIQWIPEGGVTFFAYFLHAHLLGVGIKVEQFRDGKSIGMFAEDDAYDFNYQEGRSFVEPKKVMPVSDLYENITVKQGSKFYLASKEFNIKLSAWYEAVLFDKSLGLIAP